MATEARLSRHHTRRKPGRCMQLLRLARAVGEVPAHLISLLLRGEDYSAMHGLWHLSGDKRVAWSSAVPLDAVKRIKDHFGCGCTVNDVMMAAATAALHKYALWWECMHACMCPQKSIYAYMRRSVCAHAYEVPAHMHDLPCICGPWRLRPGTLRS